MEIFFCPIDKCLEISVVYWRIFLKSKGGSYIVHVNINSSKSGHVDLMWDSKIISVVN